VRESADTRRFGEAEREVLLQANQQLQEELAVVRQLLQKQHQELGAAESSAHSLRTQLEASQQQVPLPRTCSRGGLPLAAPRLRGRLVHPGCVAALADRPGLGHRARLQRAGAAGQQRSGSMHGAGVGVRCRLDDGVSWSSPTAATCQLRPCQSKMLHQQ
jgi:hypothetical protein